MCYIIIMVLYMQIPMMNFGSRVIKLCTSVIEVHTEHKGAQKHKSLSAAHNICSSSCVIELQTKYVHVDCSGRIWAQ